jgi:putative peptidoglycan lipid II flippase
MAAEPDPHEVNATPASSGLLRRVLRNLQPSHRHSALAATLILIAMQLISRVVGYLREAYIAWAFGAGSQTDAYVAAFQLPDYLYYIVAGGAASITFVTVYTRYLAEKRERDAERVFSTVLTVMIVVLGALVLVGEVFTTPIERWIFPGFSPQQLALCVHLTRILLPMQLFFYAGGVVSAVLLSHRMFLIPAFTPIVYTLCLILSGVLLSHQFGIAALAYGAVAGAFLGPFLLNAIGAARTGIRYRPALALSDPGFREWVRLSIPLMLGVSLAAADEWIMRWFASGGIGNIARLNYAKRLFGVPFGVLGLSVGLASMPFFARLFSEKRMKEFAQTINDAVYRSVAAAFLLSAWLWVAALPLVDLVYRRGRFQWPDSQATAIYFAVFAASLALWTAQTLYSRAFYAAHNTFTPMIAASLVTLASIPVFGVLFRSWGMMGLAVASDIGILAHTVVLAVLLHRRGLASLGEMRWSEIGKSIVVAIAAGVAAFYAARIIPLNGRRTDDVKALLLVTLVWGAVVALGLWITRSELPRALSRRSAAPAIVAEPAESPDLRPLPEP